MSISDFNPIILLFLALIIFAAAGMIVGAAIRNAPEYPDDDGEIL